MCSCVRYPAKGHRGTNPTHTETYSGRHSGGSIEFPALLLMCVTGLVLCASHVHQAGRTGIPQHSTVRVSVCSSDAAIPISLSSSLADSSLWVGSAAGGWSSRNKAPVPPRI